MALHKSNRRSCICVYTSPNSLETVCCITGIALLVYSGNFEDVSFLPRPAPEQLVRVVQ